MAIDQCRKGVCVVTLNKTAYYPEFYIRNKFTRVVLKILYVYEKR